MADEWAATCHATIASLQPLSLTPLLQVTEFHKYKARYARIRKLFEVGVVAGSGGGQAGVHALVSPALAKQNLPPFTSFVFMPHLNIMGTSYAPRLSSLSHFIIDPFIFRITEIWKSAFLEISKKRGLVKSFAYLIFLNFFFPRGRRSEPLHSVPPGPQT